MTDRELLELAAKAVVYGVPVSANEIGLCFEFVEEFWNPLENDGDALRLAVNLLLPIDFPVLPDKTEVCGCVEIHNKDPYAATRRAIVCAAAEIGKEMK